MPIKTIQPFVSDFKAFAGEGFYGNVVQGLVIKQLEDVVFIFGIAIDGTLIFRKRNYPDVSTWEDPKIIIHSNNWHKIYSKRELGELLPTASNEKKGLMPAGGVSRIPSFRYSSDNMYKLEYPFYGIVGGHSDRANTTSLYVMEVDRIYKIYATSGNTISFKKDSDGNVYASGGDGGFKFYIIPFNGKTVEVYSGDISNFEQISVL